MLYNSRELPLAYFDNYLQLSSYTGRSSDELQASVCKGAGLILGGTRYILKKVQVDAKEEEATMSDKHTCYNCGHRLPQGKRHKGKCRYIGLEIAELEDSCRAWTERSRNGERIQDEGYDDHGASVQD